MGQKINPVGFRLPVTRDWTSRWYATGSDFAHTLKQDLEVRKYLGNKLKAAQVSRIVIERPAKNARITIYSGRPGLVIGKKGEEIEVLKTQLQKLMGVPVHVNIEEVRRPELDAQLIAETITQQLEKRTMFRRAMKRAMQSAMRLGAQGIKIMSSGRLNGAEIARTEWYREGRVPLHTLRADIDYGFSEAKTTYGIVGVKVWVYKGDYTPKEEATENKSSDHEDRRDRRPAKPGARRPRKAGDSAADGKQARAPRKAADKADKPAAEKAPAKAKAPKAPAKANKPKVAKPAAPEKKPEAKATKEGE